MNKRGWLVATYDRPVTFDNLDDYHVIVSSIEPLASLTAEEWELLDALLAERDEGPEGYRVYWMDVPPEYQPVEEADRSRVIAPDLGFEPGDRVNLAGDLCASVRGQTKIDFASELRAWPADQQDPPSPTR